MSMYLPNDDVGPTGAEGAEFIDVPEPEVEPDDGGREVDPATDPAYGQQDEPAGMETE
jgi:hypothetical protein